MGSDNNWLYFTRCPAAFTTRRCQPPGVIGVFTSLFTLRGVLFFCDGMLSGWPFAVCRAGRTPTDQILYRSPTGGTRAKAWGERSPRSTTFLPRAPAERSCRLASVTSLTDGSCRGQSGDIYHTFPWSSNGWGRGSLRCIVAKARRQKWSGSNIFSCL